MTNSVDPSGEPGPLPPQPARRPRSFVWLIILVLAGAAAAVAWIAFPQLLAPPKPIAAAATPPKVKVARPVVKEILEWDDFTGRFEATDDVSIRSQVTGYLEEAHFKEGGLVNKGDLLFTIDPRPFQAALNEAQSRVSVAQTALDLAQKEFERGEALRSSGNVSASALDQRRQTFLSAKGEIEGAKAALERAQLNLDYTRIVSPIAGRVSRKWISVGNLVNANDTVLTTVVALDPIYFTFEVDERAYIAYAIMAERGERPSGRTTPYEVKVTLAEDRAGERTGRMDFVDNRLDQATGTMRGRAKFENRDLFLQPGMFGRISIPGSGRYKAVLIPDEAVASDQDRRIVYVVSDDGTVTAKPIRPGPKIDGYRVVRRGLDGSERIVVGGIVRVRPGIKVTPEDVTLPAVAAVEQQ
ncbi:MAG: efflux RND transporter periplasmic adaptor subunit [Parvibaculaceae bacterium]